MSDAKRTVAAAGEAFSSVLDELANKLTPKMAPGRMMKYPYTFTAKLAQFPFAYYFKNQWVFRYYILGVAACIPVFNWIENQACSPANKEKWAKKDH
ncbi:reduction of Rh1 isoform X2 [Oratosquilla oratoria]